MPSTTTRLSNLNPREKRFLIGGSIIIVLLLAWLLWPSGADDQSNVDLVPADQRGGGAPPAPIVSPPPAPPPVAAPVPVVQVPAAAASGAPEGLRLQGVAGAGAIFTFADGSQRYVSRGRQVAPGLVLQGVALQHVVLTSGSTAYRLGFGGPAVAMAPPAATPPANAGVAVSDPAEARRMAADRAQTAQYTQMLAPRQVNGRTAGYTIRPGANIGAFERTGLRPGDTILSVNGSPLGPDQLQELAWTINNSARTEFVVERDGRRMTFTLEGNR